MPPNEKPFNPMPPLPIPKRKWVALLVIVVPAFLGLLIGWGVGMLIPYTARFASIVGFAAGGLLGLQTLYIVLAYGAREKQS